MLIQLALINGEKWEKKVEAGDLNVKDSVKEDLFKDKDLIWSYPLGQRTYVDTIDKLIKFIPL